jgi:hypothetical protein
VCIYIYYTYIHTYVYIIIYSLFCRKHFFDGALTRKPPPSASPEKEHMILLHWCNKRHCPTLDDSAWRISSSVYVWPKNVLVWNRNHKLQNNHKHHINIRAHTHRHSLSLSHTRSISKKQTCLARYSHICQPISGKVCNLDKTHYFVTFTQLSDAQARERNNRCKNPWFKNAAESKKGLPWHHKPMDTLVHRYLTYSWCFKCLSVPCWHDPHLHTLSHLQKGTSLQGASWQLVEIGSNWGLNWSDALNDSLRFPEPLWALQSVSVSPAIWIASLWGHWAKCGRSAGLLWCCNFVKFQQSTVSTVQHMEQAAPTFDMRRVCARLPCPCCTGTSAESMLGLLTGSQAFKKTIEHIRKPYIINIYFHNLSTIFDWTSHYRHLVPLS